MYISKPRPYNPVKDQDFYSTDQLYKLFSDQFSILRANVKKQDLLRPQMRSLQIPKLDDSYWDDQQLGKFYKQQQKRSRKFYHLLKFCSLKSKNWRRSFPQQFRKFLKGIKYCTNHYFFQENLAYRYASFGLPSPQHFQSNIIKTFFKTIRYNKLNLMNKFCAKYAINNYEDFSFKGTPQRLVLIKKYAKRIKSLIVEEITKENFFLLEKLIKARNLELNFKDTNFFKKNFAILERIIRKLSPEHLQISLPGDKKNLLGQFYAQTRAGFFDKITKLKSWGQSYYKLLPKFPELQVIDISLRSEVNSKAFFEEIFDFEQASSKLKVLKISIHSYMPDLHNKVLDLRFPDTLESLVLKSITVKNSKVNPELNQQKLDNFIKFLQKPMQLQNLVIYDLSRNRYTYALLFLVSPFFQHLNVKALKTLDLQLLYVDSIDESVIKNITERFNELNRFSICITNNLSLKECQIQPSKSITELKIEGGRALHAVQLLKFIADPQALRKLSIQTHYSCDQITLPEMTEFLGRFHNLEMLNWVVALKQSEDCGENFRNFVKLIAGLKKLRNIQVKKINLLTLDDNNPLFWLSYVLKKYAFIDICFIVHQSNHKFTSMI